MDKRLSIALLLTALVVAVTPILFPTPKRAPATTTADSAAARQTQTARPTQQGSRPQTANGIAPATVAPLTTDSSINPAASAAIATQAPATAEMTTVSSTKSSYRFSSLGAAPASVTFNEYKNLVPGRTGKVELSNSGRGLLSYALVVQGDTIPLNRVPFAVAQSQSPDGSAVVTYRAPVNGLDVVISYTLVPDRYVVRIAGRVSGGTSAPFLLVDLPQTLPATEADTLSDLRTLSYSFKTTRDNARGVPFGKLDPGEKQLQPGPLTWAAVRNKYFVVGLVNPEGSTFEEITLTGGPRTSKLATHASATAVKALKDGTFAFDMYVGPQQSTQLIAMGRDFDHVNPYGWSFLQPIVNPIAASMHQAASLDARQRSS